jgi:cellulose synthase/poly-beta-1,6-N-acetylglucosamine synthase-like glycosyltransferase
MIDLLLVPIAVLYLIVVGALFIYGVNFFYLTYLSWRNQSALETPTMQDEWPVVTVQLPIYNELYVAGRLIQAVGRLDYPVDRLEIQVLDDSTDETRDIVNQEVEVLRKKGYAAECVRREIRTGFKAGALAEGFKKSKGEFLAIFDADFIPPPDFLQRTVPYFFIKQPDSARPIAFIQTRWSHINRDYSFLTHLQSLAIDAHFLVEQSARSSGGFWFNFNGTAGIWRREAINSAGGWTAETLTEDLDLSYRAFLKGWGALYLKDVEVPAEIPVSFTAYRRQQYRWARGSLETAQRLIPLVWKSPISLKQKIEATLHLTGYGVHLLLFGLSVLYPFILLLSVRYPALISLFGIALVFNFTAFAPTIFFISAQRQMGNKWWKQIPMIVFITAMGAGMMVNTMRAAFHILVGKKGIFERTPKFGISVRTQDWKDKIYQLRLDPLVFLELLMAALNVFTVYLAIHLGNYAIAFYSSLFAMGLLFTSGLTIGQSLSIATMRHKQSEIETLAA